MKVTSLRDMENYIYSSVILPLKNLNVPDLDLPSPIKGENGNFWSLQVQREPLLREYRRNYQRTQAIRNSNFQVVLYNGTSEYVLATYHPKQHWVKLYQKPFRKLNAMMLLSKIHQALYQNEPFTKIMMETEAPRRRQARRRSRDSVSRRMSDYYDGPMLADDDGPEETPYDIPEVPF